MKKTKNKIPAVIGTVSALTAVAAASAVFTTKLLVKTALDRNEPQIMKKTSNLISGSSHNGEFKALCASKADCLESQPHETVTITASDGTKLIGHFFPCENAKRVIVAFHGWRSSWSYDYGLISDFFHNNGCSVLYAEQRAQNNSDGEYIGFGLTERFDCINWVNWAIVRCGGNLPIYLAGVSMGAATVLMSSDLNLPDNVCGIMADCGFTSPKAIWKHVANKNLHMTFGLRSIIADKLCKKRINIASDGYSTIKALQNTDIPVLFIHGSDDSFVPVEMTYENYKACASPKRLLIVPGADHAMSYYVNRKGYEKAVLDFWNEFDNEAN